jgi:hypothetical protein
MIGDCAGGLVTGEKRVDFDLNIKKRVKFDVVDDIKPIETTTTRQLNENFVISSSNMDIREIPKALEDVYKAMVDLGANVNLGPVRLPNALVLIIISHIDGKMICTADLDGYMEYVGWIFPRGYTGPTALVKNEAYILLSVIQLQQNGMGVYFPPERPKCVLTIFEDIKEVVFIEITQSVSTKSLFR